MGDLRVTASTGNNSQEVRQLSRWALHNLESYETVRDLVFLVLWQWPLGLL